MSSYEFALRLNREVTDPEVEALYEAGCGDAGVETGPLGAMIEFDREATSLATALVSAVRDVERVPGLHAVGLACDNMVALLDIAERAGVSREAVRLWSTGQRGPGGFPAPALLTTGGERLWDWEQVAAWLLAHKSGHQTLSCDISFVDQDIRFLCKADSMLKARHALRSEPDEEIRGELERLLEDA